MPAWTGWHSSFRIVEQEESALWSPDPGMTFDVLLEDGPLIAVNKPAGLLTQGVPHGLPSLESEVKQYLRIRYSKPGNVYLGVPHRLDRPVSGVVLFARNSKAAARLAEQFRERSVRKTYLALTEGIPEPASGRLVDWLLKDAEAAHVTTVAPGIPGAREAILDYRTVGTCENQALVEIDLLTGRMHQIRVQLGSRGWPILGDTQYGSRQQWPGSTEAPQIGLHARTISLFHPVRYDRLEIQAPLPTSWTQFAVVAQMTRAD